jgi:hypothetical protein
LVDHGFGFCFLELFAQLGGSINIKALDVGADLVGKVEKGIHEDDLRSPTIVVDLVSLHFIIIKFYYIVICVCCLLQPLYSIMSLLRSK